MTKKIARKAIQIHLCFFFPRFKSQREPFFLDLEVTRNERAFHVMELCWKNPLKLFLLLWNILYLFV